MRIGSVAGRVVCERKKEKGISLAPLLANLEALLAFLPFLPSFEGSSRPQGLTDGRSDGHDDAVAGILDEVDDVAMVQGIDVHAVDG